MIRSIVHDSGSGSISAQQPAPSCIGGSHVMSGSQKHAGPGASHGAEYGLVSV